MFVLTLVWPDWIEGIFGADPDGGNGSAEWGWTAAFAVAAFILAVDAGRMRREPGARGRRHDDVGALSIGPAVRRIVTVPLGQRRVRRHDMKNSVQADPPAALVFTGHVVQAKAATMPEISADDTAIVAVDDVVTAPPMFSAIAGTQITVRFGNLTIPRVGSVRTFHTRGWMYGQGLAVDAVQIDQEQPKQAVTESRAPPTSRPATAR